MYPFKQKLLYFATGLCNKHDRRLSWIIIVFYALLFYVFKVCCFQFQPYVLHYLFLSSFPRNYFFAPLEQCFTQPPPPRGPFFFL